MVEITLLPKFDRTQSATPNVIMNNDTMSNKCCHENEMIFSLNESFDFINPFIKIVKLPCKDTTKKWDTKRHGKRFDRQCFQPHSLWFSFPNVFHVTNPDGGEGYLWHVCQTQVSGLSEAGVCQDRLRCLSDWTQVSVRLSTSVCQIGRKYLSTWSIRLSTPACSSRGLYSLSKGRQFGFWMVRLQSAFFQKSKTNSDH